MMGMITFRRMRVIKEAKGDEPKDLAGLKKDELVKIAEGLGIDHKGLKKDELIAAIQEAKGDEG